MRVYVREGDSVVCVGVHVYERSCAAGRRSGCVGASACQSLKSGCLGVLDCVRVLGMCERG